MGFLSFFLLEIICLWWLGKKIDLFNFQTISSLSIEKFWDLKLKHGTHKKMMNILEIQFLRWKREFIFTHLNYNPDYGLYENEGSSWNTNADMTGKLVSQPFQRWEPNRTWKSFLHCYDLLQQETTFKLLTQTSVTFLGVLLITSITAVLHNIRITTERTATVVSGNTFRNDTM